MKINFQEIGAIKDGTVDLSKRLNVFCGPNGTGKTYISYVIYGLLQTNIHVPYRKDNMIKDLIENKKTYYKIDFKIIEDYRKQIVDNLIDDFDSLFGVSQEFIKQNFNNTKISIKETSEELNRILIETEFSLNYNIGKVDLEISKKKSSDIILIEIIDKAILTKDIERLEVFFFSSLISILAKYPVSSTFILPVERNSIFTFSKELSIRKQEAVDYFHKMTSKEKVNRIDLFFSDNKRYPLPIRDGLLIADDLSEIKKNKSDFYEFALEIEQELLNGKLEINNDGEIQFKPDKSPKKSLPIHMTASIIKSLSSLVVYLKHIARKNDLIIIDEPEINLHPDNQILLTRIFARLMNKGFRLIVSTHSDYIVREFNNLTMLSSQKLRNNVFFDYKKDEFICYDDIDVHYFNYPQTIRKNKQVTLQNLKIDLAGFEVPSINVAIDKQNEIAEEFYYTVKYKEKQDEK